MVSRYQEAIFSNLDLLIVFKKTGTETLLSYQRHLQLLLSVEHVGLVTFANLHESRIRRVLLKEHHVDEGDQQVRSAMFGPGV